MNEPISTGHWTKKEMKPGDEIEWDGEAGYSQQGGQSWPPTFESDLVLPDEMSWAFKEKRKEV